MNTLYFLSGPPRTAKTSIMNSLVAKTGVQMVAADALEHGIRNMLIGEPHQMLRSITLSGSAEYKASFTEGGDSKPFSNQGTESSLLLEFIIGMLDYYRRNNESVAFEGTEFSPEWVSAINLPGYKVKAAFVGYTDAAHIDAILTHARGNEHDWINDWLAEDGGDETRIRAWVQDQAVKCAELENQAEALGYPFFDISKQPFEAYKSSVIQYLTSPAESGHEH